MLVGIMAISISTFIVKRGVYEGGGVLLTQFSSYYCQLYHSKFQYNLVHRGEKNKRENVRYYCNGGLKNYMSKVGYKLRICKFWRVSELSSYFATAGFLWRVWYQTIPNNPKQSCVNFWGGGYEWQFLMLEISGGFMIMRLVCGHTSTNSMGVFRGVREVNQKS